MLERSARLVRSGDVQDAAHLQAASETRRTKGRALRLEKVNKAFEYLKLDQTYLFEDEQKRQILLRRKRSIHNERESNAFTGIKV